MRIPASLLRLLVATTMLLALAVEAGAADKPNVLLILVVVVVYLRTVKWQEDPA